MAVGRSFVDLHSHSSVSFDSLADPLRMVERAARVGLTHIAITDHERIDGALRARDDRATRAEDRDGRPLPRVIVGQEVRTADGDLIGLFLERAVPPGLSAPETAAAIREQGGLVGLPHPFDRFRSSGGKGGGKGGGGSQGAGGPDRSVAEERLAALAAIVDYVEVHNARAYGSANPQAAAFASRHGLPGVAASDAHSVTEVGIASTVLEGDFSDADGLRAFLPAATLMTGRASYYVRLWTPLAKVVQRARGNRRVAPGRQLPAIDAVEREP